MNFRRDRALKDREDHKRKTSSGEKSPYIQREESHERNSHLGCAPSVFCSQENVQEQADLSSLDSTAFVTSSFSAKNVESRDSTSSARSSLDPGLSSFPRGSYQMLVSLRLVLHCSLDPPAPTAKIDSQTDLATMGLLSSSANIYNPRNLPLFTLFSAFHALFAYEVSFIRCLRNHVVQFVIQVRSPVVTLRTVVEFFVFVTLQFRRISLHL